MFGTTLLTAWLAAASLGAGGQQPTHGFFAIVGQQATPAPEPILLRISTIVSGTDGKISGGSSVWPLKQPPTPSSPPLVVYATSGATLCQASSPTPEPGTGAGDGWRIEITPIRATGIRILGNNPVADPTVPLSLVTRNTLNVVTFEPVGGGAVSFRITWTRMWDHGEKISGGASHAATVTLHAGEHIQLDYLIAAERTVSPTPATLGELNKVVHASPCNAIGMGLEVSLDPVKSMVTAQTDVWLVHTLPNGQQETQHQVLRARPGDVTPYYFDDVAIPTSQGSVAVKVHGVLTPAIGEDGVVHTSFAISREYAAKPDVAGVTPQSAGATYNLPTADNEVLSFNLPVPNSSLLVGHAFSLRVRSTLIR